MVCIMKTIFKTTVLIATTLFVLSGCEKIPEGFLEAKNAKFYPDSMVIQLPAEPEILHSNADTIPIQSVPISGTDGTKPVKYRIHAVYSDNAYENPARHFSVGPLGKIQVTGYYAMAFGTYWVDYECYNKDHSEIIRKIYHVIIR